MRILSCPHCGCFIKNTDVADISAIDYVVCKSCGRLSPIEDVPSQPVKLRGSRTPPTWKVKGAREVSQHQPRIHEPMNTVNTIMSINKMYDLVATEYNSLLRAIRTLPKGQQRNGLLNDAFQALEQNGSAQAQLDALAQVRRDLSDRCPSCGEYDSCVCWIDAKQTVEILPGEELP